MRLNDIDMKAPPQVVWRLLVEPALEPPLVLLTV
jgi:hypothetical protein